MPPNSGNGETAPQSGLPDGLTNRGVIIFGEGPGAPYREDRATRQRREDRNRRDRERRRRDREAREERERQETAAEIGESAVAAAGSHGSSTADVAVHYRDPSAPNVVIHGPTYEAPTYEGPTYNNNPIQVQSPDIQVGGAGGSGGRGGEDRPGGRNPDDDPGRVPDRNPEQDEEIRRLQERLDEMEERMRRQDEEHNRQIEELNRRNQELEERNRELQEENERLRARIEELEHPPPPDGPTPEQLQEAMENLQTARDELARVDLRRSARITDRLFKRRREDAQTYETALHNYQQALEACTLLMIANERSNGIDEQEIHKHIVQMKYGEDARYAERIVDINDENFNNLRGFRKGMANMLRHYANLSTRNKILLGLLVGVGVGTASALTGGGLAVVVAGSALRVSQGLVGHQASLRNNIRRNNLERQLAQISQEQQRALGSLGTGDLETSGRGLAGQTGSERSAYTRENMRRNRRGTYIMLAGAALAGAGIAHLEGVNVIPDTGWLHPHINWPNIHIPGIHNPFGGPEHANHIPGTTTGGGPGFGTGAGHEALKHLPDNFNMDTIQAHNTTDFINHTFGHNGLLERQGIHAQGLTPEKSRHLAEYLQNHHWHVVEGMQPGGPNGTEQHIVDAASWKDGIHNPSHAEAWTSKEELQNAMKIASEKFGITFS